VRAARAGCCCALALVGSQDSVTTPGNFRGGSTEARTRFAWAGKRGRRPACRGGSAPRALSVREKPITPDHRPPATTEHEAARGRAARSSRFSSYSAKPKEDHPVWVPNHSLRTPRDAGTTCSDCARAASFVRAGFRRTPHAAAPAPLRLPRSCTVVFSDTKPLNMPNTHWCWSIK
jgi:hypothetical protein